MTPPIRPQIFAVAELPERPKTRALREAIEWYKTVAQVPLEGPATEMEAKYMNTQWSQFVAEIAEREGVPSGWLSQSLAVLARAEIAVLAAAINEAEAATA